jgi:hypothetical protein
MVYEIPRLDDGTPDWKSATLNIVGEFIFAEKIGDVLKAIDANARAEERERCANLSDGLGCKMAGELQGDAHIGARKAADAIRNLEDTK